MDVVAMSDKIDIYDNVLEIKTKFPYKKYDNILKKLKIDRTKRPTDTTIQKVFLYSIYLFLKGSLSQDELSNIANLFWSIRKDRFDELGTALYQCSELTFYNRRIYKPDNPKDNGDYIQFMITTMKYYEKHFKKPIPKNSY